jgi:F-type H+-transporting ATPase subunit delta
MSNGAEERLSALDGVLDAALQQSPTWTQSVLDKVRDVLPGQSTPAEQPLSAELFSVVDLLNSTPMLRRALTDPGVSAEGRSGLVHNLLDNKISRPAVQVVAEAAGMRWSSPRTFVAALERQGIRAEIAAAEAAGQLEETEDALFRFGRLVESSPELRNTLADRSMGVVGRQALVADLLDGKVPPPAVVLAQRAVLARERNYGQTLESYVTMAAAHRSRVVATVRVAKPLTDAQMQRLQEALSRQVGRNVSIQVIVDESILGGVRVQLGDEIIEGTVSDRLADVKRLFS